MSGRFLPDSLRPHAPRKSSRRPLLLVVLLPAVVSLVPLWRVQAVDVSGCSNLPEVVTASIEELAGRPTLAVSPQWVRHQLEVWPEVASVEVRLELPNTLRVAARRTVPHGSIAVGRGWHSVTEAGAIGGRLDRPFLPVLEGAGCRPEELRRALGVARRIERSTGGRVESVRVVTADAYRVLVRPPDHDGVVNIQVGPEPTVGERYWTSRVAAGHSPAPWVDLRWDDRVVMGGAG